MTATEFIAKLETIGFKPDLAGGAGHVEPINYNRMYGGLEIVVSDQGGPGLPTDDGCSIGVYGPDAERDTLAMFKMTNADAWRWLELAHRGYQPE